MSLGNEHDNPRPHVQSVWHGRTELKRAQEVDQLSQTNQLPLSISPFKMGAHSSSASLAQGAVFQVLTVPAGSPSGLAP